MARATSDSTETGDADYIGRETLLSPPSITPLKLMARFSPLALAGLLSLSSMGTVISSARPGYACIDGVTTAACIGAAVTVVSSISNIISSNTQAEAQVAAAKAKAQADKEAIIAVERIRAQGLTDAARITAEAGIKQELIRANNAIDRALTERQTQLQVLERTNELNQQNKLIDTALSPFKAINDDFANSIKPIYPPASNRKHRAANAPSFGGMQLFHY